MVWLFRKLSHLYKGSDFVSTQMRVSSLSWSSMSLSTKPNRCRAIIVNQNPLTGTRGILTPLTIDKTCDSLFFLFNFISFVNCLFNFVFFLKLPTPRGSPNLMVFWACLFLFILRNLIFRKEGRKNREIYYENFKCYKVTKLKKIVHTWWLVLHQVVYLASVIFKQWALQNLNQSRVWLNWTFQLLMYRILSALFQRFEHLRFSY